MEDVIPRLSEMMKWMVYACFGYSMLQFAVFALAQWLSIAAAALPDSSLAASTLMAFYAAAFAVLYSAANLGEEAWKQRRCPNGHPVGPLSKFCDECGELLR